MPSQPVLPCPIDDPDFYIEPDFYADEPDLGERDVYMFEQDIPCDGDAEDEWRKRRGW